MVEILTTNDFLMIRKWKNFIFWILTTKTSEQKIETFFVVIFNKLPLWELTLTSFIPTIN